MNFFLLEHGTCMQNPGCWSNPIKWLFDKTLTSEGAEIVAEINVREKYVPTHVWRNVGWFYQLTSPKNNR